jgi:hypothetical protein
VLITPQCQFSTTESTTHLVGSEFSSHWQPRFLSSRVSRISAQFHFGTAESTSDLVGWTQTQLSLATTPSTRSKDADSMSAFALTFRPSSHYKHVPLVALARVSMKSENVWGLDERGPTKWAESHANFAESTPALDFFRTHLSMASGTTRVSRHDGRITVSLRHYQEMSQTQSWSVVSLNGNPPALNAPQWQPRFLPIE